MSVLDSSNGSSLTGWTIVDAGANADVVVNSGTIQAYKLQSDYGSGFNNQGAYRTTGISGAIGHVIYAQFKQVTTTDGLFTLAKSGTINYANNVSAYFESGTRIIMIDNGTGRGSGLATSNNTWYDLKFEIIAAGAITLSARVSDNPGSFDPSSSAWTTIASSSTVTGYNAATIYPAFQTYAAVVNSTQGDFIDEYYYTDNGSISSGKSDGSNEGLAGDKNILAVI